MHMSAGRLIERQKEMQILTDISEHGLTDHRRNEDMGEALQIVGIN
jgi:hypothetical protein